MTIPTKNNFEMNASGPNELKVSYICIGNTQFSQYFDTMMSLCCLICTDEITKCIYKTPKINPPPPPVYATNDFNWKCGLHIDWVVRTFFFPFSLLPTPPPPPAPVTHSFISLSPSLPLPHLGPPPLFKISFADYFFSLSPSLHA